MVVAGGGCGCSWLGLEGGGAEGLDGVEGWLVVDYHLVWGVAAVVHCCGRCCGVENRVKSVAQSVVSTRRESEGG